MASPENSPFQPFEPEPTAEDSVGATAEVYADAEQQPDGVHQKLGSEALTAAQVIAPVEGNSLPEALSEISPDISVHPKVIEWLDGHDQPEEAKKDIILAVTKRALISESIVSVDEMLTHELRSIPPKVEQTASTLRQMQRSFDQLGSDIQIASSSFRQMAEDIFRGYGTDTESAAGAVRQLQYRVEGWTTEARRQGYQGEELSSFTNHAIEKAGAVIHQVGMADSDLQYAIRDAGLNPEDHETPESAYGVIDEAQEESAEDFTKKASRDADQVHGLFDALNSDGRRLMKTAEEVSEGGLSYTLLKFPEISNELRYQLDDMERSVRSGNAQSIESLGRRIIQQLGMLEQQAKTVYDAAGRSSNRLNEVENTIHAMTSSMRSHREYFRV